MLTIRRVYQLGLIATTAALFLEVLHRASHAPWRCDETCRWWQIWPKAND